MNTVNNVKVKKTAIFFGSPNNAGNTAKLLDAVLKHCPEGTEATLLCVFDLNVTPCNGCDCCKTNGQCVYTGDDFSLVDRTLRESERIIIATPTYFLGFPAPLKAVFDRFQAYFYNKPFQNAPVKKALLLTTGGSRDLVGPKHLAESSKRILDSIHAELVDVVSVTGTDKGFQIDENACKTAAEKLYK